MNEFNLPWYADLLGHSPEGNNFKRLLAMFKLSSRESRNAGIRWYENQKFGVSLLIRQGKIDAIQFYSAEHPDFDGFSGSLPFGLDFKMTRDKVHAQLGDPDHSTSPRQIGPGLEHSGIDRYYTKTCTVAVSYSAASGQVEVLGFELPKESNGGINGVRLD